MHLVCLAMYVTPPPLTAATAELWEFLRAYLARPGVSGLPDRLDTDLAYDEAWLRPDLLLSQTCGYPYVTQLRGRVRLVATPVYSHPGCEGPLMRSVIVVRRDSVFAAIEDLRDAVAAVNSPSSNSGANLLRAAVTPLAREGRFFAALIETGSHGASIDAVAQGRADCAAIDCVTLANIQRFDRERVTEIRQLALTPASPGLPFITSGGATDEQVELLREALMASIRAPFLAVARDTMGLVDFDILPDARYEVLLTLAKQAEEFGYRDFDRLK